MQKAEVWKEYKATGYYVSNMGNIIGKRGGLIRPSKVGCDYLYISMCIAGVKVKRYVHDLVWLTHDVYYHGYIIDHKNDNKLDNRHCNLQLITRSQNTLKHYRRCRTFIPNRITIQPCCL